MLVDSKKLDLSGVPECVECGTCCFSRTPDYLRVMGIDHDRLGEEAERLVRFIGNRAYMKMQEGHCAALIYEPTKKQFLCSVYERRPDVCRWLERGSGQCNAERVEKADRPLTLVRSGRDGSALGEHPSIRAK